MNWTINDLESITKGVYHPSTDTDFPPKNITITKVSTDTREDHSDQNTLFVPLIGPHFDGHDYMADAFSKGAILTLSEKPCDFPHILVSNTKKALFELARAWRDRCGAKIIGITGSNGKTTTKDILYSLLRETAPTRCTSKNLNNEIGVAQTLLSIPEGTRYAIVEMGIEDFGEMRELTHMVHPDIGILTNIGDCHLKKLRTRENICRAKLEMLDDMADNAVFYYNGDDETIARVLPEKNSTVTCTSYGLKEQVDYRIEPLATDETGCTFSLLGSSFTVPLLGRHQLYNGAIAILIAIKEGLSYGEIAKGLRDIHMTGMRNELLNLGEITVLNDAYKSNPQSLDSCLVTAYQLPGFDRKILIIGDMLDLGEREIDIHENVGEQIQSDKIDYLLTVGTLSRHIAETARTHFPEQSVFHFDKKELAYEKLKTLLIPKTLVAVKASRAIGLDNLVDWLENDMKEGNLK